MKWTEKYSESTTPSVLPCLSEAVAGPLTLSIWKVHAAWEWQVTVDPPIATRSEAQARCLAVATGILLQRVREAWGGEAYVYFNGGEWVVICGSRVGETMGETMARHDGPFGWHVGPTETKALVAALKAKP